MKEESINSKSYISETVDVVSLLWYAVVVSLLWYAAVVSLLCYAAGVQSYKIRSYNCKRLKAK